MKLTLFILPMRFSGPVWFLLLAITYPGTVQGKVVDNFQSCHQFFKDGIAPWGFENEKNKDSMVKICQMYKGITYFATLYRTDLRIPVYSAYIYTNSITATNPCRPRWFCEPQIENRSAGQNMQTCKCKSGEKQALNSDYNRSGYQRGHLYPFSFNHQEGATASCTLTNAVPEKQPTNTKWYHDTEKVVKGLAQTCHNSGRRMYLVTGSADYNHGSINNRVAIPGLVWTAACCTVPRNQNDRSLAEEVKANGNPQTTNGDFSIAFMGTVFPNLVVVNVSVSTLERRLNATIFNECKEATREIYEEVQRLRDNKKRQRVGKCSLAAGQKRLKLNKRRQNKRRQKGKKNMWGFVSR